MMISRFTFAAVVAVSISGTVAANSIDPLSERIWSNRDQRWIDFETLIDTLESSPRIVIGERHGFAPHQDRIALILQALAERGRYPRLVMEHLKPSQMEAFEVYREANPEYAGGLGVALEWWDTGWPAFKFYEPIFSIAFSARLEVVAGDLDNSSGSHDKAVLAYWTDELSDETCNPVPKSKVLSVAEVQATRDLAFADTLTDPNSLLVTGARHVVPMQMIFNVKKEKLTSLSFKKLSQTDFFWETLSSPDSDCG